MCKRDNMDFRSGSVSLELADLAQVCCVVLLHVQSGYSKVPQSGCFCADGGVDDHKINEHTLHVVVNPTKNAAFEAQPRLAPVDSRRACWVALSIEFNVSRPYVCRTSPTPTDPTTTSNSLAGLLSTGVAFPSPFCFIFTLSVFESGRRCPYLSIAKS